MNINNNAGLQNFGNTCFMNASLQLLMTASTLIHYMISNGSFKKTPNIKYIQTFIDYMSPKTTILGPRILHINYMNMNTRYRGGTQEDSHEFLTYTLDDMIENVKSLNNNVLTALMEKYMTVEIQQNVHYKKGQDEDSMKQIKENMLSFPIDETCKTLYDCFKLFKEEDNDEFTLRFNIVKVPKYLFISIKRFINNGHSISKNDNEILIPSETNMFHPKHNYKLKGFIMHVGGYGGGHYYSYGSRKIDGCNKWFLYNDTHVSEVNIEKVSSEMSKAYILLYSHM